MCEFYIYINNMKKKIINTDKNLVVKSSSKEKISWSEELWKWLSNVIKWVTDSLFNSLAAWRELIMSWVSKLSEKLWSKDSTIIANRKNITNHHLKQTKKSVNKVWNSALDIIKWWFHTTKWAIRTVFTSGKETVKWLREKNNDKKNLKKAA